jgi:hypothetical protein
MTRFIWTEIGFTVNVNCIEEMFGISVDRGIPLYLTYDGIEYRKHSVFGDLIIYIAPR